MKKISQFAASLVFLVSLGVPLFASAACPSPYVEDDGQCYSVTNGVYTRQSGVSPTATVPSGTVSPTNTVTPSTSGSGVNLTIAQGYATGIKNFINDLLVPVLMAIAFIVFLWGIFRYFIWGAENESEKAEGRKFAMWGIIGFVIILCVWGLVAVVTGTLNLTPGGAGPKPPTI